MSRAHSFICSFAVYAVLAVGSAGCNGGDGLPRQPISGSVTLDGRRLEHGVISFYPSARLVNGTMVSGASTIDDGRFSISRDAGLTPGKYKVAVNSADFIAKRRQRDANPDDVGDAPKDKVPTKYNSDTVLEIEIEDHQIKHIKIDLGS